MLKLVKWAYKLGVRNERHRIAAYLQSAQEKRSYDIYSFEDDMRRNPIESNADANKRQVAKRERKAEVDKEIINIIQYMFHGEEKYERGTSVMFPDEDEL